MCLFFIMLLAGPRAAIVVEWRERDVGMHVDEARQDVPSGKMVDGSACRWTIAGCGEDVANAATFDLDGAVGFRDAPDHVDDGNVIEYYERQGEHV